MTVQPETHLRQGIALDLSWQTFDDNELGQIIESVNDADAVWFIAPQVDTQMQTVFNQLASTHVITYEDEAGGILFYRLYRRAVPE